MFACSGRPENGLACDVRPKLQALSDVGLDYLTLGQPLSTLSGGECQRINKGGKVIFEGTPRELLGAKHSLTSQYVG